MFDSPRHAWLLAALVTGCTTPRIPFLARFDEDPKRKNTASLVQEGTSFRATAGANAVFHSPRFTAHGRYRLSVLVEQLRGADQPHGAGLVFGGTDLDGEEQRYAYVLLRPDGRFLVKVRRGDTTTELEPWTVHPAVRRGPSRGGVRNRLSVEVDDLDTRILVNGTEVCRLRTRELPTDGRYGFRVLHDLTVRFSGLTLTRLEP